MAGMGFDAHISALFASDKTRGLKGYIKSTFTQINTYKPEYYTLELDGEALQQQAFMVSIANSSQYGNNVHIAPEASLYDGLLDVCIVNPFPIYCVPIIGWRMLNKTVQHSAYVSIIQAKKIKITRLAAGPVHLDGEPCLMGKEITVQINPLSLNLIT